jgi:hypothetical protein
MRRLLLAEILNEAIVDQGTQAHEIGQVVLHGRYWAVDRLFSQKGTYRWSYRFHSLP